MKCSTSFASGKDSIFGRIFRYMLCSLLAKDVKYFVKLCTSPGYQASHCPCLSFGATDVAGSLMISVSRCTFGIVSVSIAPFYFGGKFKAVDEKI